MRQIFDNLKLKIHRNRTSLSIILVYEAVTIIIAILFQRIFPTLLNFPPGSINTKFDVEVSYISSNDQYIGVVSVIIILSFFLLRRQLKGIDTWKELMEEEETEENRKRLEEIRHKCLYLPYIIYISGLIIPTFAVVFILSITGSHLFIAILKMAILIFAVSTLAIVIATIFAKRMFTKVLLCTYREGLPKGARISLRTKVFLQIIPIMLVSIVFTSLIGYSRIITEKGDILFEYYELQLKNVFKSYDKPVDAGALKKALKQIKPMNQKDCTFIIPPGGQIETSNNSKVSSFFMKYLNELSDQYGGRVYEVYVVDTQASTLKIIDGDKKWIVGVKYEVGSAKTLRFFLIGLVVLFSVCFFVVYYLIKTLTDDIKIIAESLAGLAEGNIVNLEKQIPITSNDEIGDLVEAFNDIQKIEKQSMEILKENEKRLIEMAEMDGLTGAYNRRFFDQYYELEVKRAQNQIRYKPEQGKHMNFGLAMLDIDNFKKVNDTYGHLAGDNILKQLVETIKEVSFTKDIICRYGGEEFIVLFTRTDTQGAVIASEKIRQEIEAKKFFFDEDYPNGRITVSIGVAVFDDDFTKYNKDILRVADERLLLAKKLGKNRVVSISPAMEEINSFPL
ncbi:MAG: diguanylate cyclase [Ignavibacteriales bacterium]